MVLPSSGKPASGEASLVVSVEGMDLMSDQSEIHVDNFQACRAGSGPDHKSAG